tara:strand:+ start:74 stop:235 length:162 start_codon:yes stop_codon:yes gene_type:complete
LKTYEIEFDNMDMHWIAYAIQDGSKETLKRFVNRDQAEEFVERIIDENENSTD